MKAILMFNVNGLTYEAIKEYFTGDITLHLGNDGFYDLVCNDLKPLPQKKDLSFNELHLEEGYERKGCTYGWKDFVKEKLTEYDMGYNNCIDEITGETE